MSSRRSTRSSSRNRRRQQQEDEENEATNNNNSDNEEEEPENNVQIMQRRNRAVAEREASRLARPERPAQDSTLGHASKDKSAVTSTPFGFFGKRGGGAKKDSSAEVEEWCGPFSVARQMIAAREAARREREKKQQEEAEGNNENENGESHPLDDAIQNLKQEEKKKAHPSLCWKSTKFEDHDDDDTNGKKKRKTKGKKENLYVKRQRRQQRHATSEESFNCAKIPSLFSICVDYLVSNFDYVEALGIGVDTSIRRSICQRLVERGVMNGAAFDVLAEEGIEALELVDCTEVTQSQLSSTLERLLPSGLKALLLHHAGRCFGPQTVQSLVNSSSSYNSLFALSIGGAYLLKDDDAVRLVECMYPTLSSIEFKACPLLGEQFCKRVGECYSSSFISSALGSGNKEGCLLELSLEDLNLKKEHLLSIVGSDKEARKNDALRHLRNLSLKRIECLDDDILSTIFSSIGYSLESVDLSENPNITDVTLSYIRRCNVEHSLSSLTLSGCRSLTSMGLETLFTMNIEGLPAPPCLKRLDLSRCGMDVVTDAVVEMAALASSAQTSLSSSKSSSGSEWKKVTANHDGGTMEGGGKGGLVHLNISDGSITDVAMEKLAVSCALSLKELNVSFCTKVSDKGLGYLVSKVGRQLRKINVWGCAQITEEFVDGHDRVDEIGGVGSLLEIEGVWMKKAGNRSIR